MIRVIGEIASEFSLKTSEGKEFAFSELNGQWKVVFFFYRGQSAVCKRGCLSFKEQYDLFRSLEPPVEVIGISRDSVSEHKKFKENLQLPFTLLSDPDRKVAEMFNVPTHLGSFPSKSSFVIGPDNKIHYVYDWLFRPRQHVANILSTMSSITSES